MAPGRFVAPFDFIWDNAIPLDFDGHGTHVAGTIGQLTNDGISAAGVAFNVKIMPVKVLDSIWDTLFGSPNVATDDVVARGIRYAADNGADVINMSIGRAGPPNTSPVIEEAIKDAVGKGVFVAIAGGNEFEVGNPLEVIAEIASRVDGAVSVAAIDRNKAHAYYSSTGSYIELSAPGGSERGFGRDGYVFQQTFDFNFTDTFLLPPSHYSAPRFDVLADIGYIGTSMATPHVSGVAAMMKQQGIKSPAAIEAAMEQTAVDLGSTGSRRHVRTRPDRRARRAAWSGRSEVRALALMWCLAVGVPANVAAQPPDADTLSLRPFVMGTEQMFSATHTFDAVFGQSHQPFFGGGLQVSSNAGISPRSSHRAFTRPASGRSSSTTRRFGSAFR